MKSSNVILAVVGVALLVVASQFAQGQSAAAPAQASILSKLKVGVSVHVEGVMPYRIYILSAEEVEKARAAKAEGRPTKYGHTITEVGGDYIIATYDDDKHTLERTIPIHSIGEITRRLAPRVE